MPVLSVSAVRDISSIQNFRTLKKRSGLLASRESRGFCRLVLRQIGSHLVKGALSSELRFKKRKAVNPVAK